MLFKIGEFSKYCNVTVKTIRHYEEIGLLKPYKVDKWTGYRLYSLTELNAMLEILDFKQMGFSLDEIKEIMQDNVKVEHVKNKLSDLLSQQVSLTSSIAKATEYLNQLKGVKIMEKVTIKTLPKVIIASMRVIMKNYDELNNLMPNIFGPEMGRLGCECAQPEYCFNIYHDGEYKDSDVDVELCQAVVSKKIDSDIVKFKELAEVPMAACVYHRGAYENLSKSYALAMEWINFNGYEVTDNARESYLHGIWDRDNTCDYLTELQFPVRKAK